VGSRRGEMGLRNKSRCKAIEFSLVVCGRLNTSRGGLLHARMYE
jgi:hypothetical protein